MTLGEMIQKNRAARGWSLHHCAVMIGDYIEDDGWMIHEYPEIEAVTANHLVEAWMPLPEMYGGH